MIAGRPTLLLTRRLPASVEQHLQAVYNVQLNPEDSPLPRDALIEAMGRYDAILPTITDRFDAQVIEAPGRTVQMIANFGAGYEHIDLEAARKAGVCVSNTPDALTDDTADLTFMLILMAMRRAGEGDRELRNGGWSGWRPTHMLGRSLNGKILGLIGFGRIAQAVAVRAAAFGMQVRYFSRSAADPTIALGCKAFRVDALEQLVAEADVVSLHVPANPATRHLIDGALLARMKPSAVLINTSRGSVVDEAALADFVQSGRIGAAGLDVYEFEPAVTPQLLVQQNTVLLPHLGSATIEARTAMGMQAAANLRAFFAGEEIPNRIA